MKKILNSFIIAFSMFSKIPVKEASWTEENMRYVFCFFPLIGAVIGIIFFAWFKLCVKFSVSAFFFAGIAAGIPVLVTGGIHLDGFIDISDALGSHGDKETRLMILRDAHVGAFGVIMCAVYFILQLAALGQLYISPALLPYVVSGFVMSRAVCAFSILLIGYSKDSGLAYVFCGNASRRVVLVISAVYIAAVSFLMIYIDLFWGTVCIFALILTLIWYRRMCGRLGGVTGDSAGYLVQVIELVIVLTVAVGGVFI